MKRAYHVGPDDPGGVAVDGQRPVLEGGGNTIEAAGDHDVFEGFDITAGTNRCFFHHAGDMVLRDANMAPTAPAPRDCAQALV